MPKKVRFIMSAGFYKDGQIVEIDEETAQKYDGKFAVLEEIQIPSPKKETIKKQIEGGK
jgi:hypothetical protein